MSVLLAMRSRMDDGKRKLMPRAAVLVYVCSHGAAMATTQQRPSTSYRAPNIRENYTHAPASKSLKCGDLVQRHVRFRVGRLSM